MQLSRALGAAVFATLLSGCYDIQGLPGGSLSEAYALNEAGDVVGYGTPGHNVAYLWPRGTSTPLELLASPGAYACAGMGINDAGLIVGSCFVGNAGQFVAVKWSFTNHQGTPLDLQNNGILSSRGTCC